jgi:acyl-CoA thioesterase FadM
VTGIVSRWVVLQEHAVTSDDLDTDGHVRDDLVERWVDAACAAYLGRCRTLHEAQDRDGLELRSRISALPPGARLGRPTGVAVSAGAREFRRRSFTIAVRIRTAGGEPDVAVNAACVVSLEDPATSEARALGDEVRDDLIALEHRAKHLN